MITNPSILIDGKSYTAEDIKQLELERDQLAAQNARLQEKLKWINGYLLHNSTYSQFKELFQWGHETEVFLEESPAASLAEIRAKAIESAVERVRYEFEGPMYLDSIEDFFDAICEEVRQQAKQGGEQ